MTTDLFFCHVSKESKEIGSMRWLEEQYQKMLLKMPENFAMLATHLKHIKKGLQGDWFYEYMNIALTIDSDLTKELKVYDVITPSVLIPSQYDSESIATSLLSFLEAIGVILIVYMKKYEKRDDIHLWLVISDRYEYENTYNLMINGKVAIR
jgi:hypothetical protein